ncbi:PREDICTED: interferon omega-2 [Myotis davidii]|uniref:interferon omega-2 n=1 Tax=Myotis davidii TaxID=225400 RepID=UPI0007674C6F|nr:PREDICTED: interferon omega-2 [Myotis davidii]
MALLLPLLTALVVFSAGPGRALGCDLPQDHEGKDFRFPRAAVDGSQVQKAQAIAVLHEMLQQVSNLLSTENSSVTWNMTLVDQLRSGLHRQLEDLDMCLVEEMGEEGSALAMQRPTLALRRYFQGVHLYLKEKEYSDCAWEVVRVEIMRSFSSITALQEKLRNKDGNVGSP